LGVVRLIEEHAREHGILDAKGELTSGLTHHYLAFNRHIKECLALLGLGRVEPPGPTLEAIIAEHDAKNRVRIAQDGRSRGVEPGGPDGTGRPSLSQRARARAATARASSRSRRRKRDAGGNGSSSTR